VAGGLGRHFDLDPVLFRIAFVVLTLVGGSGILLYLTGWLLIPEDTAEQSVGQRVTAGNDVMKIGIVVLAIVVSIPFFFFASRGFDGLVVPLLILAGAVLWIDRDRKRKTGDGVPSEPAPGPLPAAAPTPEPVVEPGPSITKMVLSTLLIAGGAAALADQADLFQIKPGAFLAFALVVVGIGLIIGSKVGRSRGLIPIGIVLTVLLGLGAATDGAFRGGAGERSYRPLTPNDVRDEYGLGAGELTLDLTDLRFPDEPVEIDVRVFAGEVLVIVPDDINVSVRARAGAGDITVFDHNEDGISPDVRSTRTGDRGELDLNVRVALGEINVREESR
jgi:phage shock protein PspC (stress-responsive transcriptional regulator)